MKSNNKIYTILLAFSVLSILLIVLFVLPLQEDIKRYSDEIISAKNSVVTLSAQTKEIDNFNKNYDVYKPNLDKIDKLFFDSANPVDFIEFLEKTAAVSNVTSNVSFSGSPSGSQPFVVFQFSSEGSFSNVLDFVQKIEFGPYLTEVENLTIQNTQASSTKTLDNGPSRIVRASLTIKAYTKK